MNQDRLIDIADLNIARRIALSQANEYEVLPLYEEGDNVYVAAVHNGEKGRELLSFLFNKKLIFININKIELEILIKSLLDFNCEDIEQRILEEAISYKASDIHFEPMGRILNIRFRINGSLIIMRKLKINEYNEVASRLKIKANMDITERRKPQDGKIRIKVKDIIYNCRLSTIPVIAGEKIVLRIMYQESLLLTAKELKFSNKQQKLISKMVALKTGLFIVNGPTGSGKSTTLYSIINSIKEDKINITTLEDPIEFNMLGINQIDLNPKIGITFAEGLKSILRQDPDVIMLGEIRDEETAKMAVRAAITGHKVYSTIHTKSPREVFLRLEEMGVKGYLVRDALCGIISQRLVRILCDKCKTTSGDINIKGRSIPIYKKEGCIICKGTGYIGRKLIASVNYINKDIYKELKNIYENDKILSNNEMAVEIIKLLKEGEIDYKDFKNFIEGEELNEDELQEFITNI